MSLPCVTRVGTALQVLDGQGLPTQGCQMRKKVTPQFYRLLFLSSYNLTISDATLKVTQRDAQL